MTDNTFTVTDDHLKLLRNAYIGWDDCEFGAPAIDCNVPTGTPMSLETLRRSLGLNPRQIPTDGATRIYPRPARRHDEVASGNPDGVADRSIHWNV